MTNLTETIQTTKCRINHYGSRPTGTCVNFQFEGSEHEIILPKFNMKEFEIQEALENLTPYELEESLSAESLRENDYMDDINLIFGGRAY